MPSLSRWSSSRSANASDESNAASTSFPAYLAAALVPIPALANLVTLHIPHPQLISHLQELASQLEDSPIQRLKLAGNRIHSGISLWVYVPSRWDQLVDLRTIRLGYSAPT